MVLFERCSISFVAVTQQFNICHSMGRLTLNILLSFAQFERELIAERTRDKIAAARRRGKWVGGMPLLGYDLVNFRLVVNAEEAQRVRSIFALYLHNQSLTQTVRELTRRGWMNKLWTTRKGRGRGGRLFHKSTLHRLLASGTYVGKVGHKNMSYPGEHEALVDETVFEQTQQLLARNQPRASGRRYHHRHEAMLDRLVYCAACSSPMRHHYTVRGTNRYRYYVCLKAQREGRECCPCPSIPAAELEQFIVQTLADERDIESLTPRQQRRFVRGIAPARRVRWAKWSIDGPDAWPSRSAAFLECGTRYSTVADWKDRQKCQSFTC